MNEVLSMFFYQGSLRLYRQAISVASLFNPKARLWIAGRKNWQKKLKELDRSKKTVWFHTASLGEYEQARPVIEKFKKVNPQYQILVTFFSPSGYEIRKDDALPDLVCYLPLDTKANAKEFIDLVNPELAVFVRYEFWPNLMDVLAKRGIRTTVISANFRTDQFLFKPLGQFIKNRIMTMNKILVQYPEAKDILLQNNFEKEQVAVCGDSRIDRVLDIAKTPFTDNILASFVQDKKVLVLGSSYTDEESFTFPLMEKEKDLKIIIAPHYVDDKNVQRIIGSLPVKAIRYTEAEVGEELSGVQVLLLDTMGRLAASYQYGHFALVGGGFKNGIHSILEPAAHGLPLYFGPNHKSFPEAQNLIDNQGGFMVNNQGEFINLIKPMLHNDELRKQTGEKVLEVVNQHAGASEKITAELNNMLK